ncbi:CbtA family protein [Palleronia sp.]|uniref:CbtA family protein n=1 Tax=Palleronia sp. TaxID=1940284 RepID=UPI0035C7CA66
MLARILTSAVIAGFAAGLVAATLQLVFVQPVLLHAELYEAGELLHFGSDSVVPVEQDLGGFNLMRDGLSVLFSALVYVGYALIVTAAMAVAAERGVARITGRTGILWGIAGWVAVQFGPAIGLPPELPGVAAADLAARRAWWAGTVVSTGTACALLGFGRSWMAWGAAIVLFLLPHVIGAPQPEVYTGPTPPELAGEFAARALGVGLAVWVCLGALAGHLWSREMREAGISQPA